jgi:hypothetical protein
MAGPWDSPKLVTAKRVPKVLPLIRVIIPERNWGQIPINFAKKFMF